MSDESVARGRHDLSLHTAGEVTQQPIDLDQLIEVIELPGTPTQSADASPPPAAVAAIGQAATAMPSALDAIRSAAAQGSGLRVVFPADVVKGLRNGSLQLLTTADGSQTATAVHSVGRQFAAQGRVVGDAGRGALSGATVATGAVVMLPVAVAAVASYQQQRALERAMADIQATLDRIEERLRDEEHGVCEAAESFLRLVIRASEHGPLPQYLLTELASHRVRVEGVYAARRRWVYRFKSELERQQVEFEQQKGERQPWVDQVQDFAKEGVLTEELLLFVRSLIVQSKLDALAAWVLADEGVPELAMELLHESQLELRSEFYDLHNRLRPLASIAPPTGLRSKIPLLTRNLERAHGTAQQLVAQLDDHVLPTIPDPHNERDLVVDLDAARVRQLAAALDAA